MHILASIFKLLAGIGLFLFAMNLLEESLKNLSGRRFKIFLQRSTKNKAGAIFGGTIVTGALQSSSMVSIMVLAFVGAGVFTMKNAMAIILGANLGTTLDSWLVATLGFEINIETLAYPAVFIGGLLLIIFSNRKKIKYISYFLFGFGLLFIGFSFMKTSMEDQVKVFDFSSYAQTSSAVFLLIGFIITLLVQSSSVTMALALSALHAGAINFPSAAAIVLGSETGTTIKILIGAIGGITAKKRVALGNLFFNIFLTVLAFSFLKPLLLLITDVFSIKNPLIGLVTFSTMINLFAILIFLPFLDPFAKFLERFYKGTDPSIAAFIGHANVEEPETALDLFRKETEYFIHDCMLFDLKQFEIDAHWLEEHTEFTSINEKRKYDSKTSEEKYGFLKKLQGEMQVFYIALRIKLKDDQYDELDQLISAARNAMHAVKSIKDISTNMNDLMRSSKDIKFDLFAKHKKSTEQLYRQLNSIMMESKEVNTDELKKIFNGIKNNYTATLDEFYKKAEKAHMEDLDMTTAISFNRELFASNKAMFRAVSALLIRKKEEDFEDDLL